MSRRAWGRPTQGDDGRATRVRALTTPEASGNFEKFKGSRSPGDQEE